MILKLNSHLIINSASLWQQIYRAVLIVLLSLCITKAVAQTSELQAYTVEDGVPQSQVYAITQDETGYLWLGTQGGGLARFDGDTFDVFNEKKGLISNYINALVSTKNTIYIGTQKGVSIYKNRNFNNFNTPTVFQIRVIHNIVFICTAQGIYTLTKDDEIVHCALSVAINTNAVNDVLFKDGAYWIATSKGLYKTKSILKRSPVSQIANGNFKSLIDDGNLIFAATFNEGIQQYDSSATLLNTSEKPLRINSITLLDNALWVSTDAEGLFVLNPKTLEIDSTIDERQGLTVRHIRSVFKDRNGQLWIATSGGGFFKYFPNQFTHYDKDTGLTGNRIYALEATKDRVWFSVEERGLSYIDSLGIKRASLIPEFQNVKIKTLASDASGSIWAGSEGKGLLYKHIKRYDSLVISGEDFASISMDTLKIEVEKDYIVNESKGFPSNWIRDIYIDDDVVWAATYGDGIIKFNFDTEEDQITILKTYGKDEGIEDLLIRDIQHDGEGRIWYATQKGSLGFINESTVTHLGNVLNNNSAINTIIFKDKTLILGTADSGIYHSTNDDYTVFKPLSGEKTPTSKNSYLLLFDAEENLWTGSERGVDKLILDKNLEIVDVFHYGRNDGFLGIETCLNAAVKDDSDKLWFGAIYGLTSFENSEEKENLLKPTIYFESVDVGYTSLDWDSTLGQNSKTLQLKPEENQLSFTYRTVDLNHPKEVQYRYQIDDSKWSPWSTSAQQNFAGLASGKHEFKAQSRNYRWIESDPVSVKFNIGTPLYKEAWFQFILIAFALLIVSFLVYRYVRNLKKKNRSKQTQLELENHLLGLEQKALRLQMNPHFIFNVLNGIKAMGVTDTKKMNTTINSFATLLRGILNNSRKEQISLTEEINVLKNYIEVEQLMAVNPFKYSLKFESNLNPDEVLIPPMLVQPFVENAIKHGISAPLNLQTRDESVSKIGFLEIIFKTDDQFLTCIITDNGPGIFESQKNKKTTSHQSVALEVTKERIESLSGVGNLHIIEVKENDIIKGTKIAFKIPLELEF